MSVPAHNQTRTSWQVARSVWSALFLREATARVMASRFAWFWIFAEPIAFVVLMVFVRDFLGRVRMIQNADFIPWLIVGISVFILFRDGVIRSLGAIENNQGLFSFRQVKPVDPVLVRNILEGLLQVMVFIILITGASLLGFDIMPFDPIGAILVWVGMWLLGLGFGLVCATLSDGFSRTVKIAMLPLFILSGVIFPLQVMPHSIRQYLLYNPVVHGVESLRLRFFDGYHTVSDIDLFYIVYWIFASIALGLALHVKFAIRLRAK